MTEASLYEVFSSVQGEATRIGERHLFVRMAGCDVACSFCDTPASRRIPERFSVHLPGGAREVDNPVSVDTLHDWMARLDEEVGPHHAVALTGGEPLLFAPFLARLARRWREKGVPILLETGGHRPDELEAALDFVDYVMADVKIPSSAGFSTDPQVARRFLRLAAAKECAVKVVVSASTTEEEVVDVARLVADAAPAAPLVLQPVSGARNDPPAGPLLLSLQRAAMRRHPDTRVIPQAHRLLHVR